MVTLSEDMDLSKYQLRDGTAILSVEDLGEGDYPYQWWVIDVTGRGSAHVIDGGYYADCENERDVVLREIPKAPKTIADLISESSIEPNTESNKWMLGLISDAVHSSLPNDRVVEFIRTLVYLKG